MAYAAVDRHRLEDLQPYLYRTRDFGKTWLRVTTGIPEGSFLNCVREDPARKALLYACTELGVYVSFNDGDSWQPLQLNLPTTSIRDLVIHGDDLVIATFGRAFWILDDVTPLRQMSTRLAASDVWLFRPASALRVRPGADQGTPVPHDEPLAENPPTGAVIDYYLKEKAKSPVRLEIYDQDGKLVRRFSSDDQLRKTNPDDVPLAAEWIHDPAPLSADGGAHRFVWDLRYPLPKGIRSSFRAPAGPWALPGKYTVTLTANGKSSSQPLVITMDPRVKTPREDLVREFEVASRITASLGEVSAARQQAEDWRKQIAEHAKQSAANAELAASLPELDRKLSELIGAEGPEEFGVFGLHLPDAKAGTLHKLSSALIDLLFIVDSVDAAPTSDASTAIDKWEAAASDTLTRWHALSENAKSKLH
jgi:hypothetical protein